MSVSRIIVTTERGAKYLIDFASRSFSCVAGRSTVRVERGPFTFRKLENVLIGGRMLVTWDDMGEATFIASPVVSIVAADEDAPAQRSSSRQCGIYQAVNAPIRSER